MSSIPSETTPIPLRRYKLIIAYNGTNYSGFQRQTAYSNQEAQEGQRHTEILTQSPKKKRGRMDTTFIKKKGTVTIQERLEEALAQYSGLQIIHLKFRFAGRTDAGVHARGQVVAVSLPISLDPEYDKDKSNENLWKLRKSINSRLPDDISVEDVESLTESLDFDPRKDTIRKRYSYTLKYRRKVLDKDGELLPICTGGPNCVRSGLDSNLLWVSPWPLDDSKLQHYCNKLVGEHDYSAFVHKKNRRERSNLMTVQSFDYDILETSSGDAPVLTIRFQVVAKGFRRSMVRNLVGFIVDLCRGKIQENAFNFIWSGTNEAANMVHSAPPYGLCLECVEYGH